MLSRVERAVLTHRREGGRKLERAQRKGFGTALGDRGDERGGDEVTR